MKDNYTKKSWQKVLDAAKRGNETRKINQEKIRKEYLENPKKCKQCGEIIPYLKRLRYNFCNNTCSAIYNSSKRISKANPCLNCSNPIKKGSHKFCSQFCMGEYRHTKSIKKLKDDFENGLLNDEPARRYFRKITEKKCSICNIESWMGQSVPLIVDHIDGNHNNNFPNNFRLVCCNCDAQLDTYKSKNKGNGRKYRRI